MFSISCWITICVLFCSQLSWLPVVLCLGLSPLRSPPHIIMSVGVILVHLMFGQPCWWDFMSVPFLKIHRTSSNYSTRQEKPSYKLVRVVQETLKPLSAIAIALGCFAGWEGKPLLLKTPWSSGMSLRGCQAGMALKASSLRIRFYGTRRHHASFKGRKQPTVLSSYGTLMTAAANMEWEAYQWHLYSGSNQQLSL